VYGVMASSGAAYEQPDWMRRQEAASRSWVSAA
jgi:hypothetical protein